MYRSRRIVPSAALVRSATVGGMNLFAERYLATVEKIADASRRYGQPPVRLLPVSKTIPVEALIEAWPDLRVVGCETLAENRIQEAHGKFEAFHKEFEDKAPRIAVIGPLQTNKAGQLVDCASEFHALDRPKVAAALERRMKQALKEGKRTTALEVLIQVNTSREPQKAGLDPREVPDFVRSFEQYPNLRLKGFMTMAMRRDGSNDAQVRQCFADLRGLRDSLADEYPNLTELSMGMSGDYELAIAEGATTVRVGTAIFGERPRPA